MKVSKYKKGQSLTEKLVCANPLLFLYETDGEQFLRIVKYRAGHRPPYPISLLFTIGQTVRLLFVHKICYLQSINLRRSIQWSELFTSCGYGRITSNCSRSFLCTQRRYSQYPSGRCHTFKKNIREVHYNHLFNCAVCKL
jgi:hypothetical protein